MKTEDLQEYIQWLSDGNAGFKSIKNHPIVQEILKDANLRFWIPDVVVSDVVEDTFSKDIWETTLAKNIAAFLRLNGYTIDFKNRTVSKDGGKNNQRIGRVLQAADPKLIKAWKKLTNTDSKPNKNSNCRWVISANPVDICNATYGRKWKSCLADGHHIFEMENGSFSLIAYLCDEGDKNIADPHARYLLHVGSVKDAATNGGASNRIFKFVNVDTPVDKFTLYKNPKELSAILLIDTLYGNCSGHDKQKLQKYLREANNDALKHIKSNIVPIDVSGLYVNKGFPGTYKKVQKVEPINSKTKVQTVTSDIRLKNRVKRYNYWSTKPNYELLEYVINTHDLSNSQLNGRLVEDPNHVDILRKTAVIPTVITDLKEKLNTFKKKLVKTDNNGEINALSSNINVFSRKLRDMELLKEKLN
jgi:hypothetical protein